VGRHGVRRDTLERSEFNLTAAPKERQKLEFADFILTETEYHLKKVIRLTNF
jgi:hypothetical protein